MDMRVTPRLTARLAALALAVGIAVMALAPAQAAVALPQIGNTQAAPFNADVSANRQISPPAVTAAPAAADVQGRLQLLKELHDKGLITDQEYDAKRKEIVDQI